VTIAVGKDYYLKLAENLLRSFHLWNWENDIQFLLVTDNAAFFAEYEDLPKINIKNISLDAADKSFTSKFKLFDNITADENIFVDCDCLIYKDLSFAFDLFKGKNFSAIGNTITSGNFFGDVKTMLEKFDIPAMPKFVGCLYYFKNNEVAKSIFNKASELKKEYDNLGFLRLMGKENEEPLLAVSMAIHKETLVPNNGEVKVDMMYYEKVRSNVLNGYVKATGPITEITGCEHIPDEASPAILHFNDVFADEYLYQSDLYRLDHAGYKGPMLESMVWLRYTAPEQFKRSVKSVLRPAYRYFLGHRKVRVSKRLDQ